MRTKRISQTGVGQSDWLIVDDKNIGNWEGGAGCSLQVEPNGGTITIQATLDPNLTQKTDVVPAAQIAIISDMSGLTTDGEIFEMKCPVRGVRINQTVGAGTSSLTILQDDSFR